MSKAPLIALLAGSRETRMAAQWLAGTPASVVAVWARGADRVDLGLTERDAVPPDAVGILDATPAFDTQTRATAIARLPRAIYGRVGRAPWIAEPGDRWTEVDTLSDAITALPSGARVFAATGRASLAALSHHDGPVVLRQLTRHVQPTGYPNCRYEFGTAPFDPVDEAALFQRLQIDVLLARNIGGTGSFPKLAAARALGCPVVLLRPPALPMGAVLRTAADVAQWVEKL